MNTSKENFAASRAVTGALPAVNRRLGDQEILDWAMRHDLRESLSELRCIAEDASSIALLPEARS